MMKMVCKTIDDYINLQEESVKPLLETIRRTIKETAPEAEECISYQMPAFKQNGPLAYFAAYKNHIGFYPTGSAIAAFQKEISDYKNSKGAVQFPLDQPIPTALIRQMVLFKRNENSKKVKK